MTPRRPAESGLGSRSRTGGSWVGHVQPMTQQALTMTGLLHDYLQARVPATCASVGRPVETVVEGTYGTPLERGCGGKSQYQLGPGLADDPMEAEAVRAKGWAPDEEKVARMGLALTVGAAGGGCRREERVEGESGHINDRRGWRGMNKDLAATAPACFT